MSQVNVINVIAHNAKAPFLTPLSFEIFFEALQPLRHTLTWRIIYIGQASDSGMDQILEEAEMEEIQPGQMKFVFEGQHPDTSKIQESEIVGVTGVLVTCSYNQQEFFRVGYYVNNYYENPELAENPPERPLLDQLTRHILVEKPRVTKFQIQWEPTQEPVVEEGTLLPGSQYKDRHDMMSSGNLQAAAAFFGGAPQ
ncbi:hypothetical protein FGO68_gene15805 [Halteria grandinella]|uniref:Uncharacterized protein n=1 Tax=Halteria grandinella TaxID=5974 RepID=A0A8J8SWA6_HALGN|nr:hypothetical protein FGO68_gene15805 [Halteria grandinella]